MSNDEKHLIYFWQYSS